MMHDLYKFKRLLNQLLLPISVFSTVLSYGRHSRMKIPYERMSIIRNFEQRHRNNPRLEVEAGAEYSDVGGKKYYQ